MKNKNKKRDETRIRIYVNEYKRKFSNNLRKEIDGLIERKVNDNSSDVYLNMLEHSYIDLKPKGYFARGNKTIDNYITTDGQKPSLDEYMYIPPMHKFYEEGGIDGETNPRKILKYKSDRIGGIEGLAKSYRNSKRHIKEIEGDDYIMDKILAFENKRPEKSEEEKEEDRKFLEKVKKDVDDELSGRIIYLSPNKEEAFIQFLGLGLDDEKRYEVLKNNGFSNEEIDMYLDKYKNKIELHKVDGNE